MHAINFALKRAHLCTVAIGQRMLDLVDPRMTPARFDLLYYIRRNTLPCTARLEAGFRRQRDIVLCLAVDKSTVSKMLRRLEEIGWVEREPLYGDRRQKLVKLTKNGLRILTAAMRLLFRQRVLARPYDRIARLFHPTVPVSKALRLIWATIDGIARFMADTSTLWYDGGGPHFYKRAQALAFEQPHQPKWRSHHLFPIDTYLFELGYFVKWLGRKKKEPWVDPWEFVTPEQLLKEARAYQPKADQRKAQGPALP